ncbi:MAG: hypothetical protein NWQ45_13525, partial [Congregibacter sp.]|nr:hypothetical protein [Congregibacter sp.]
MKSVFSTVVLLLFAHSVAFAQPLLTASPERMQSRIEALSAFGANPEGGVSRVAFTDADLAGREWLKAELRNLGLT